MFSGVKFKGAIALLLVLAVGGYFFLGSDIIPKRNHIRAYPAPVGSVSANWWQSGQDALQQRLAVQPINTQAKNVILFIGDGMGVSTVTAARIYDGQSRDESGEENALSFDKFPHVALIKTYTNNGQVAQSAGTATAMNTGIKTSTGVIGIAPEALRGNCKAALQHSVKTLAEYAEEKGMSTGVVTTAGLTHATGAAVYAHSAERIWEDDTLMPDEAIADGCKDIARQFAEFSYGDGIDIALGGGRNHFLGLLNGGLRIEATSDLTADWQANGQNRRYITTKEELLALEPSDTGQVLGLFSGGHMSFQLDHTDDTEEPTLSDMTAAAVSRLSGNDKGYYLMVEGGRIDHGHHKGQAEYALTEAQEFSRAIQTAIDMVDLNETLILVTADHSHTMTIAGYPHRGNSIMGNVRENDMDGIPKVEDAVDMEGKTYSTLGYQNGPGAVGGPRPDAPPRWDEEGQPATQQALVSTFIDRRLLGPRVGETHAGEDVALYAIGPKAHLVGGVLEQNVIFHIMTHALGWDPLSLNLATFGSKDEKK
jgi:alkaline phosphatase